MLELYGRCGVDVFPKPAIPDYFPEKGYKKILNSVCVETNPIRKSEYYTPYLHIMDYCFRTGFGLRSCVRWDSTVLLIPSTASKFLLWIKLGSS